MAEKFWHCGRPAPILKSLAESDLLLSREGKKGRKLPPFYCRPDFVFFEPTNVSSSSSSPTSGIVSTGREIRPAVYKHLAVILLLASPN